MKATSNTPRLLASFIHIVQFCHLCSKGKIPVLHHKLTSSPEPTKWFIYTLASCGIDYKHKFKWQNPIESNESDSDDAIPSPNYKVSRADKHLFKIILKLNGNKDKQSLHSQQECKEKEPGLGWLEFYPKNLILNAMANPPFDSPAEAPTEFYNS